MSDTDDAMTIPPEYLKKGRRYAWVLDEKKMQTTYRRKGYSNVLPTDEDGKKITEELAQTVDGTIRVGDAILMACPEERAAQREKDRAERDRNKVRAIKREFHEAGASAGVQTFEDENQ